MPIAKLPADFKQEVQTHIMVAASELIQMLDHRPSVREIEKAVWRHAVAWVSLMLTLMLARRCAIATEDELKRRGLGKNDVQLRLAEDSQATLMTTAGPVRFPLYAYRVKGESGEQIDGTRVPARHDVLPLYPKCHASELCIEWEVRLGSDHPFRLAQQELNFFSHGAVTSEDNTINRHLVRSAAAVDRSWLYAKPETIRQILRDRAMVDLKSGKPVVYISSDAHALRRYIDETWDGQWKMANGVRLWCVDRHTGEMVHLGGEFTWGNCEHVAALFSSLIDNGILPVNGDYGDGIEAQFVWLSDGAPWLKERIVPLFGTAVMVVLDVYHVLEHAAAYAAAVFKGKPKAKAWYAQFRSLLIECKIMDHTDSSSATAAPDTANATDPKTQAATRKGHKKRPRQRKTEEHIRNQAAAAEALPAGATTTECIADLLPLDSAVKGKKSVSAHEKFCAYLGDNCDRIDYFEYRQRGFQIGSGAMESIHRNGSQMRLKRPGATYLAQTSQALFNWRMLRLAGRWDEFWQQPNLAHVLAETWDESVISYQIEDTT